MTMTEQEISQQLDTIQQECDGISAECRNVIHACRFNHPLGRGADRTDTFRNAAFMLSGRSGVSSRHIEWLNKTANQFHTDRAS